MKIKIIIGENDLGERHIMQVNGKETYRIQGLCECPEDAIIGRDLIDAFDLLNAIKLGYAAGKNGEELEIEEEKNHETNRR